MGSFGGYSVFDDVLSQKRLIIEQNRPKFGFGGKYLVHIEQFLLLSVQVQFGVIRCSSDFSVYRILLTAKCSSSMGLFGVFLNLDYLVSRKRLVIEQNGPKFGPPR